MFMFSSPFFLSFVFVSHNLLFPLTILSYTRFHYRFSGLLVNLENKSDTKVLIFQIRHIVATWKHNVFAIAMTTKKE